MYQEALEFIKEKTDEMEFPPTRITHMSGGATILGWAVPGKYAEMDINNAGMIFGWIAFETSIEETWLVSSPPVNDSCIDLACYFDNIHVGLIKLQDFVE